MNQKMISQKDELVITIEFNAKVCSENTECVCSQPLFLFGDFVTIIEEKKSLNSNCQIEQSKYQICAMELICASDTVQKPPQKPCWKYGIREQIGTKELVWFEESELAHAEVVAISR